MQLVPAGCRRGDRGKAKRPPGFHSHNGIRLLSADLSDLLGWSEYLYGVQPGYGAIFWE